MKKRRLRVDRAARREAYYAELRKLKVLDKPDNSNLTKAQLIEQLKEMGIEANIRMTKNELLELFPKEDEKIADQVTEQDEEDIVPNKESNNITEALNDNNSNNEDESIEEIEIDEVKESKIDITTDNTVEIVADQVTEQDEEVEEIEV